MPPSPDDFVFAVFDVDGEPLRGLTPAFQCYDVATGDSATSPEVFDLGDGIYSVHRAPLDGPHLCGALDFGSTAHPQFQWQLYDSPTNLNNDIVLMVRDLDGLPLEGASSVWLFIKDIVSGTPSDEPVVVEFGRGIYAVRTIADRYLHVGGILDFGVGALSRYQTYDFYDSMTFSAVSPAEGAIRVTFARDAIDTANLVATANYSVDHPVGSVPISVNSVERLTPSVVQLNTTGQMKNGGAYLVNLLPNTARALVDGVGNMGGAASFSGVADIPNIVRAYSDGPQSVVVEFSREVRMVNPLNADDALNYTNYNIPGLTISNSAAVSSTKVRLTTTTQLSNDYALGVIKVKDLAGNQVSGSAPLTHFMGNEPAAYITAVTLVSSLVIQVDFSIPVLINSALYIPSNYSVEAQYDLAEDIQASNVVPVGGPSSTSSVLLVLRAPVEYGTYYKVAASGLTDINGRLVDA